MAASTMLSSLLFTGCSSTSALKEDEQLFAGDGVCPGIRSYGCLYG